jgi:PIN domain nuclease of toxin-antitoxin system
MRYLINSNLLIDLTAKAYISDDILSILDNCENIIYVSSESVKEFIHWLQSGKVTPKVKMKVPNVFDFIENVLGIKIKYIAKEHLQTMAKLDKIYEHNDPNDRLIIAQAITEKIPLISSDRYFHHYIKMGLDFIPNYRLRTFEYFYIYLR